MKLRFLSRVITLATLLVFGIGNAIAQTTLPAAQVGQPYSYQVTTTPAADAGTIYTADGLPPGMSINGSSGLITGTPNAAGTYNATISLQLFGFTNTFDVIVPVNAAVGTLTVTSDAAASAIVGHTFSYTVMASGAATSLNVGQLPPGLTFSTPTISGVPTAAGTFDVPLSANSVAGTGATKTLTITIAPAGPVPLITSALVVAANPGTAYPSSAPLYQIAATNSPAFFSATGLPFGLSVDALTGKITGTTTVSGVYPVILSAANNNGTSDATTLALAVGAVPAITSASTANAVAGKPFSFTFGASNSPTSYNVVGLPSGLTVDPISGAVTGTLSVAGTYSVKVSANNSAGTGSESILTVTVATAQVLPVITSAATASGVVGSAFNFTVVASNSPTTFTATGLPAGLVMNTATGAISGVPSAAGTFTVKVSAANAWGDGSEATLQLSITSSTPSGGGSPGGGGGLVLAAPTITTQPTALAVKAGSAASFTVAASGTGPLTYQWYKDGAAVVGATGSTFGIAATSVSDAGTYKVAITNSAGTVTSTEVLLQVTTPQSAPTISSGPDSRTIAVNGSVTFSVVASGIPAPTYQWRRNQVPIIGATGATLTLSSVQFSDAGSYDVVVTNGAGSATSGPAVLTVTERTYAGRYFGALAGSAGSWALLVRENGSAVFLAVLTSSKSAVVAETTIANDGTFAAASTTSNFGAPLGIRPLATLTVVGQIVGTQVSGTLTGANVGFTGTIDAANTGYAAGYIAPALGSTSGRLYAMCSSTGQFVAVAVTGTSADGLVGTMNTSGQIEGTTLGGAKLSLRLDAVAQTIAGTITAASGATTSLFAGAADGVAKPSRITNFSVRALAGTGDQTLIAGFSVSGSGTKQLLVRAVGPSLVPFGIMNALTDPQLKLYGGNSVLMSQNDDWAGSAGLTTLFKEVGAFALTSTSKDAALAPSVTAAGYSVHATTATAATGVALIELYDADATGTPTRLTNVSARDTVGSGEGVLIAGFVIDGNMPKTVLIRGVGPALSAYGVGGVLADPQVAVFSGQTVLAQNDNWDGSASLSDAFAKVGAFRLAPGAKDAALVVTLKPGNYTVQVSGVNGATGVGLIEVYDLD